MVSREAIEAAIGPLDVITEGGPGAHLAPGLHHKHYSPRTPLQIGGPADKQSAWLFREREASEAGRNVRMPVESDAYARELYGMLHTLDAEGWDRIVVEPVPDLAEWAGVRDRLRRAVSK
jgi:L-threonylcarbamoyladenylate synthase